jgi:hypothetical protein
MLKSLRNMNRDISKARFITSFAKFLDSAGKIARDLWWTNQFSPVDIIPPCLSMLFYHLGMNNRPVGGRSSET